MSIRVAVKHDDRTVRIETDADYDRATLDHLTSVAHNLLADPDGGRFVGASVEFGFQPTDGDGDDDAEG